MRQDLSTSGPKRPFAPRGHRRDDELGPGAAKRVFCKDVHLSSKNVRKVSRRRAALLGTEARYLQFGARFARFATSVVATEPFSFQTSDLVVRVPRKMQENVWTVQTDSIFKRLSLVLCPPRSGLAPSRAAPERSLCYRHTP